MEPKEKVELFWSPSQPKNKNMWLLTEKKGVMSCIYVLFAVVLLWGKEIHLKTQMDQLYTIGF